MIKIHVIFRWIDFYDSTCYIWFEIYYTTFEKFKNVGTYIFEKSRWFFSFIHLIVMVKWYGSILETWHNIKHFFSNSTKSILYFQVSLYWKLNYRVINSFFSTCVMFDEYWISNLWQANFFKFIYPIPFIIR